MHCQKQSDCFWFNGYCAWLCVCSAVMCPSLASAAAGKLSVRTILHIHIPTHKLWHTQTLSFGYAPLGGLCLKQEADVTAWLGNIGRIEGVCLYVSLFVCLQPLFYSQCPYCISLGTPLCTHPLLFICGLLDSIDQPLKAWMSEEKDRENGNEKWRVKSESGGKVDSTKVISMDSCFFWFMCLWFVRYFSK